MKKEYQHILFDLDRTIWDFEKNSEEAIHEIYNHFNIKKYQPNFNQFFKTYKDINEQLWEDYRKGKISKQQLSDTRFGEAFKACGFNVTEEGKEAGKMYLELSVSKTNTFPSARETIEQLSKKYKLHIVTNGFKEVQEKKLVNCNLREFFDCIITSEDAGFQKPDSRIFDFTFKQTGASTDNSIMIGDDEKTDITGAADIGMDSIWFNPNEENSIGKASTQIKSLEELITIL
jgi:putative hydrolase of the HAD superfamily